MPYTRTHFLSRLNCLNDYLSRNLKAKRTISITVKFLNRRLFFYILFYLTFTNKTLFTKHSKTSISQKNSLPADNDLSTERLSFFTSYQMRRFNYSSTCGPADTRAFPASFPSYFLKLLMNLCARSFAFVSHSEASA